MFFSSDYHVFRAAIFARSIGLDADGGPGARTPFYYRVPAFIREFIAILRFRWQRHAVIIGAILLIIIILSGFTGVMQYVNNH